MSRHIAAAPETIWDLLTDIARIPSWYDDWDVAQRDDAAMRLHSGATFGLIRHRLGAEQATVCNVITFVRPTLLTWIERTADQAPVKVEFHLALSNAGGTTLTMRKRWM